MAKEIVVSLDNGKIVALARRDGGGVLLSIGEIGNPKPFEIDLTLDDSVAIQRAMTHFE